LLLQKERTRLAVEAPDPFNDRVAIRRRRLQNVDKEANPLRVEASLARFRGEGLFAVLLQALFKVVNFVPVRRR
jgi:hypothetical protein